MTKTELELIKNMITYIVNDNVKDDTDRIKTLAGFDALFKNITAE